MEEVRLELPDLELPEMVLVHLELPDLDLAQMGLGEMALGEMVVVHLNPVQMIFQCRTFYCAQPYDISHIFSLIQFGLTESCSSLALTPPTFSSFLVFQASSLWEVAQYMAFQFCPTLVHRPLDI